jgi:hypothetical protein
MPFDRIRISFSYATSSPTIFLKSQRATILTVGDVMNDILKKNVCDILDSSGVDLRNALDVRFRDLKLVEPAAEDYQLLDKTIATIQEGIWTSDDPDFDYDKLKAEISEALLDGRRAETEDQKTMWGKVTPSSVTELL